MKEENKEIANESYKLAMSNVKVIENEDEDSSLEEEKETVNEIFNKDPI